MASLLAAALACGACGAARTVALRVGDGPEARVPGLDRCDDFGEGELRLTHDRPAVVLVHGCFASSSRLRTLAKVFEARGHEPLCYSYNDRASIERASVGLLGAIDLLADALDARPLTVVGHSQGGLVARQALARDRSDGLRSRGRSPVRLVTVSSPFNGIRSASHCGSVALHVLSFGIATGICQAITGSKWPEIHHRSTLVRRPGPLDERVTEHVRIATDERGSCRRSRPDGRCAEDDFVFSLAEQENPAVDGGGRVDALSIRVGHAAVIGLPGRPPELLVETLQGRDVMIPTPPGEVEAFRALLARLY